MAASFMLLLAVSTSAVRADEPNSERPTAISVAQPDTGPALSSLQPSFSGSIQVRSGSVTKSAAAGRTTTVPLAAGTVEVDVRFPAAVDSRATTVSVQVTDGDPTWHVEPRGAPAPDTVAFAVRGSAAATLSIEVQPPLGATAVPIGLRVAPTTSITRDDAGQTVRVPVGERVALDLGEGFVWSASVGDETIFGRVVDPAAQTYQALKAGSTTLSVQGDPVCYGTRGGCLLPSLTFDVQIVAEP